MSTPTVLLIGATGRLGLQVIRAASASSPTIPVHAFCRTPSKLPPSDAALCASVVRGDARTPADLRRALSDTAADLVIMAVGIPNSTAKSDVREMTAKALMDVIHPSSDFEHVKALVVSSNGAGGTKINIGFGFGKILAFVLRHIMIDHDNQEEQFKSRIGDLRRLLIVRPTGLTDNKATGKTTTFDSDAKAPTSNIDREDLAQWIVDELCAGGPSFGRDINITGTKTSKSDNRS